MGCTASSTANAVATPPSEPPKQTNKTQVPPQSPSPSQAQAKNDNNSQKNSKTDSLNDVVTRKASDPKASQPVKTEEMQRDSPSSKRSQNDDEAKKAALTSTPVKAVEEKKNQQTANDNKHPTPATLEPISPTGSKGNANHAPSLQIEVVPNNTTRSGSESPKNSGEATYLDSPTPVTPPHASSISMTNSDSTSAPSTKTKKKLVHSPLVASPVQASSANTLDDFADYPATPVQTSNSPTTPPHTSSASNVSTPSSLPPVGQGRVSGPPKKNAAKKKLVHSPAANPDAPSNAATDVTNPPASPSPSTAQAKSSPTPLSSAMKRGAERKPTEVEDLNIPEEMVPPQKKGFLRVTTSLASTPNSKAKYHVLDAGTLYHLDSLTGSSSFSMDRRGISLKDRVVTAVAEKNAIVLSRPPNFVSADEVDAAEITIEIKGGDKDEWVASLKKHMEFADNLKNFKK